MDLPFDWMDWHPTKPPEFRKELQPPELDNLIASLNRRTRDVYSHPYDPSVWLARAEVLQTLQYPELAVGDTYKALQLCHNLLATFHARADRKLGHRMGFWMVDEEANLALEKAPDGGSDQEKPTQLQAEARHVKAKNLSYMPAHAEGRYLQRPYPWMAARHRTRDDALVARLNEELADEASSRLAGKSRCYINRNAFDDNDEVLGMFAARDLDKGSILLTNDTRTWGCNGAGEHGDTTNLHGGSGCPDPIHPNLPNEYSHQDLRWIRDRAGSRAAYILLCCRFLICCLEDGIEHPLDHHLLARLTPTYRQEKTHTFVFEDDVAILNEMLQQFGVDIFANPNLDTWVLFTLRARVDNNAWSGSATVTSCSAQARRRSADIDNPGNPLHTCVSPLFSLLNHSCEPNVSWTVEEDGMTMVIHVDQNIKQGEQLLVMYDGFLDDKPLEVRRKRLKKWLDRDCPCTRCLREEAERMEASSTKQDISVNGILEEVISWDTAGIRRTSQSCLRT